MHIGGFSYLHKCVFSYLNKHRNYLKGQAVVKLCRSDNIITALLIDNTWSTNEEGCQGRTAENMYAVTAVGSSLVFVQRLKLSELMLESSGY